MIPTHLSCPVCHGSGTYTVGQGLNEHIHPCASCKGTGRTRTRPRPIPAPPVRVVIQTPKGTDIHVTLPFPVTAAMREELAALVDLAVESVIDPAKANS